jgi:hypothetical protein
MKIYAVDGDRRTFYVAAEDAGKAFEKALTVKNETRSSIWAITELGEIEG